MNCNGVPVRLSYALRTTCRVASAEKEGLPMESYICPVCKEVIEHDLMVFLKHTDKHIIDVVLKEHPRWAHQDGICRECLDYYTKSMGHTPYGQEA